MCNFFLCIVILFYVQSACEIINVDNDKKKIFKEMILSKRKNRVNKLIYGPKNQKTTYNNAMFIKKHNITENVNKRSGTSNLLAFSNYDPELCCEKGFFVVPSTLRCLFGHQ